MLVFLTYSNTFTYNTNNLRYQYSLRTVSSTKFKVVQPIFTKNIDSRGTCPSGEGAVNCLVARSESF